MKAIYWYLLEKKKQNNKHPVDKNIIYQLN